MILVTNRQRKIHVDVAHITKVLEAMIKAVGYSGFDVGLLLTTNKSIRVYNREFRNKDKPTDILSFPFHTELKAREKITAASDEEKNLGDIIISLEYVQKKAVDFDRSFDEHLIALLAHGIAHLLNYDHHTDEEFAAMHKVETTLLKAAKKINA